MKTTRALRPFLSVTFLMCALEARAQTSHLWDGGDPSNGNWSAATNWAPDVTPPNPTTNYLAFAGVTRLSNTADVPWTALGIIISNNAGGFTLNGSDLTLTQSASLPNTNVFTHNGASNVVINNKIILPTTPLPNLRRQFYVNGAGGATFNGAITNTGTDTSELWIRGTGSGVGTINGRITIGTNKLFRTDMPVTWVIGTSNNIWGITEMDNTGVLRIAAANALPTNTLVQFDTGIPRLDLNNFNQTVLGLTGTGMVRTGTGAGSTLTISDLGATNTFPGFFVDNGRLTKMGSGRTILTSTNGTSITGNVVVAEGVLQAGAAMGTQYYNSLGLNVGNRTIFVNAGATLAFNSRDTLTGVTPMSIAGIMTNNGYQMLGPVTLSGGTIYGGVGNASPVFQNYTLNGDITVTGTTASAIVGSTAAYPGFHLTKAGGVIFNVQDVTLDPNVDLTVSAQLWNQHNTGLPGSLIKTGLGTMLLTGNNPFTGGTTISNGTLALGTSGSISNSTVTIGSNGTFDVSAIALALGSYKPPPGENVQGFGTVNGSVFLPNAAPLVLPGTMGTPGTLTMASDFYQSPSYTNYFDLTNSLTIGSGINDLLVINGNFDPAGQFDPVGASIYINPLAPLITGTYRLINYGTSQYTNFNTTVLGATSRDTWTLDTSIATQVNLIVSSGTNLALRWSANNSAAWDLGSTNWTVIADGTTDRYFDADSVLFDDSGAASNIVALNTTVKPSYIAVNSSSNYTINGSGSIADGFGFLAPITKDGSGSLTMGNASTLKTLTGPENFFAADVLEHWLWLNQNSSPSPLGGERVGVRGETLA